MSEGKLLSEGIVGALGLVGALVREERKVWFCKRVVVANVPSLRFWGVQGISKS